MTSDLTWWLYILLAFVSSYGYILFSWWSYKAGDPSDIFQYVRYLFLGIGVSTLFELYARTYYHLNSELADDFLMSWAWPARLLIILGILIIFTGHMTYRVFWQRKKLKEVMLRHSDQIPITVVQCREEIEKDIYEVRKRLGSIEKELKARKECIDKFKKTYW